MTEDKNGRFMKFEELCESLIDGNLHEDDADRLAETEINPKSPDTNSL